MTENEPEEIKNLNLPLDVWQQLKESSELGIQNSKIGFYQHTALADLCSRKIAEFRTDDDKTADESVKEVLKELSDEVK